MTAFSFRLDREGYVCGGACDTSARSNEAWRMRDIPIVPLAPADIAWPDGERWDHQCMTPSDFASDINSALIPPKHAQNSDASDLPETPAFPAPESAPQPETQLTLPMEAA